MKTQIVEFARIERHRHAVRDLTAQRHGCHHVAAAFRMSLAQRQRSRHHDGDGMQDRFGVMRLEIGRIAQSSVGQHRIDDIDLGVTADQRGSSRTTIG